MAQSVLERIFEEKIIAIVRGVPSSRIVALARALAEGPGVRFEDGGWDSV